MSSFFRPIILASTAASQLSPTAIKHEVISLMNQNCVLELECDAVIQHTGNGDRDHLSHILFISLSHSANALLKSALAALLSLLAE